jgi:hypothetical protein
MNMRQQRRSQKAPSFPLNEVLPELAYELEALLTAQGESILAGQVAELRIVGRCHCGDSFCAMFYTKSKPAGAYGPGHRAVALTPETGIFALDVIDGKIAAVEVLYRDEIRKKIRALLP